MTEQALLRDLLRERHWQTYRTFCTQYDKAARTIDSSYVGAYPSRAQLHRWQSGEVKSLPYPRHCEVLEAMFPGVKAAELFEPVKAVAEPSDPASGLVSLEDVVSQSLTDDNSEEWPGPSPAETPTRSPWFPFPIAGEAGADSGTSGSLARALRRHGKRLRLSDNEISQLARLAGNIVDLNLECAIDIAEDGWATVSYRFEILNLTQAPVRRILREQWFETTDGPLRIEALPSSDRKVSIQRTHDTANMSKFACAISPAIEPGEIGVVAYTASGGRFSHDHYWRQSVPRHARHFTLSVRHRGVDLLLGCTAMEDQADGSQISALDDLACDDEDGSALMTITRDYLHPGQAVTLRWEVARAASR